MKKTILLVDDEVFILKSLKRLLVEEGYCVVTANSGIEGLELLEKNTVQVIISDQRMPQMKGSEFLKQVNQLYPDIISIIVSAYTDYDALTSLINDSAIFRFINKPWKDEVVLQYIKDAFIVYQKKKEIRAFPIELSGRDQLTQLNNRFTFYDLLWKTISDKKKQTFAIICLDIDRFNKININLGQKESDQILQVFSNRLKANVKNVQNITRLGSDEFAILVTNKKNLSHFESYLERLITNIKSPIEINKNTVYLTMSAGISFYPAHGNNPDQLMKRANLALNYSKDQGGDHYQLYEEYLDQSDKNLALESELHQALEKEELIIYFQPIYCSELEKIRSVEALLRWQHPKQEFLLPSKFLPICEESNFILSVGKWALRSACQQIKKWQNLGYTELQLAVNLSARQFNNPKLLAEIVETLDATKFPPNRLELEITETLIIQNMEKAISTLKSLRGLGIHLSLDDFGTGYSSLSYLKKFPFTSLKIDKSFIDDIKTNNGKTMVETIIAMGKSLDLKVIAEGVETAEQFEFLKSKNCDFIQGYYFSKAIPAKEIDFLLKKTSSPP